MVSPRQAAAALARLLAALAVAVVAIAVPARVIEAGPVLCLFRRFLGVQCWGCGMTRAFSHALHGQFAEAWRHNHLVVIVLPVMVAVGLGLLRRECKTLADFARSARKPEEAEPARRTRVA